MIARLLYGTAGPKGRRKRRVEVIRRVRNPALSAERGESAPQVIQLRAHGRTSFEMLTPAACARELGFSESRVIQLIRAQELRASKLGRQYVVLDEDLEEFVELRKRQVERIRLDYKSLARRA